VKCSVVNSKGERCDRDRTGTAELCSAHQTRLLRWGHVDADRPIRPYTPAADKAPAKKLGNGTEEQRFYGLVRKEGEHWWWEGGVIKNSGYGQVCLDTTPETAGRAAWRLAHGPVPEGARIVPTCGNKLCVKLSHLEARYPNGEPVFEFTPEELAEAAGVLL
jgi:hypothetical protein